MHLPAIMYKNPWFALQPMSFPMASVVWAMFHSERRHHSSSSSSYVRWSSFCSALPPPVSIFVWSDVGGCSTRNSTSQRRRTRHCFQQRGQDRRGRGTTRPGRRRPDITEHDDRTYIITIITGLRQQWERTTSRQQTEIVMGERLNSSCSYWWNQGHVLKIDTQIL